MISPDTNVKTHYRTHTAADKLDFVLMHPGKCGIRIGTVFLELSRIIASVPSRLRRHFAIRLDNSPIQTVDSLVEFVQTRAAYVAQTSLYGYLKSRMGTRFRQIFEDEEFLPSINTAKWRTYAACLSDLAVFAAATAGIEKGLGDREITDLARYCFATAVRQTFDDAEAGKLRDTIAARFDKRIGSVVWHDAAAGEKAFTISPLELINSAPIAEEFKRLDKEIVTNSIRFRWRDVREQLRKKIDRKAICADWRGIQRPPVVT